MKACGRMNRRWQLNRNNLWTLLRKSLAISFIFLLTHNSAFAEPPKKPSKNVVCATLLALMTSPHRYQQDLESPQDANNHKIELETAARAAEEFRVVANESSRSDRRALNDLVSDLKAAAADPEVQSGKKNAGIISISVSGREEIAKFLDFFEEATQSIQREEQRGKKDQIFYAKWFSTFMAAPVALVVGMALKSHSFAHFLTRFDGHPGTQFRLAFLAITTVLATAAGTALVKGFILNKDSGFQPSLAEIRHSLEKPDGTRTIYHHVEGRLDHSHTYLSPAIESHVKDELIGQMFRPFGFRVPFTNFYYQDLKFDMAYSEGTADSPEPTLTMWLRMK